MKKYAFVFALLTASICHAEIITVPGISGITLDTSIPKDTISLDFELHGLAITANQVIIKYSNEVFTLSGSATVEIEGSSIAVELGSENEPGVTISKSKLEEASLAISTDFTIKGVSFSADGFGMEWDSGNSHFEIFGSTTVSFDGESASVSMGDASSPGIEIKSGVFQKLSLGISANFHLSAMEFIPDELTFELEGNNFELYGGASFKVGSEEVTIGMGDDDSPGVLVENGTVKHINLSISDDFEMKGLALSPKSAGIIWDKSAKEYGFHGTMDLEVEGQAIEVALGNSSSPGLVLKNGVLHSFNADINSDFHIGGLEVSTKDLDLKHTSNEYKITGELEVDELWDTKVQLGEDGQDGLVITTSGSKDKFHLQTFEIEVSNVELGAISLNDVVVSFKNDALHEVKCDVSFPPGYEVDADMTFVGSPAKLDGIDISFEATSFETTIPIGDTGIELVFMEGSMKNIANPSKKVLGPVIRGKKYYTTGLYFEGACAFVAGGPASVAGKEVAFVYNRDEVVLTKSFVYLSASLDVGAYRHSFDDWRGTLGDGSINMFLDWGREYKINAHVNIPSDPLVKFDLVARLSQSGHFDALFDATFYVPHHVPFIGGKRMGSVDAGLHYNPHSTHSSFAAAWVSYKIFWKRHYAGAKYSFGSRKVYTLGTGGVKSASRTVHDALSRRSDPSQKTAESSEWINDVYSFEINDKTTAMIFDVNLDTLMEEVYVSMNGPDGSYDVYELNVQNNGDTVPPTVTIGEKTAYFENVDSLHLFAHNHLPEQEEEDITISFLAQGQYDLIISYKKEYTIDSLDIRSTAYLPNHMGSIEAKDLGDGSYELDLEYWSVNPDSSFLTVYWTDTNAYLGSQIGVFGYGDVDEDDYGSGKLQITFDGNIVAHGSDLQFYYTLSDAEAIPYFSSLTSPISHVSHLSGSVVVPDQSDSTLLSGFMVYIDENSDSLYGVPNDSLMGFEPAASTDDLGNFEFHNLVMNKTYRIGILVPPGYFLEEGEDKFKDITYTGVPVSITFNLKENE